jgi:hypothetical protein
MTARPRISFARRSARPTSHNSRIVAARFWDRQDFAATAAEATANLALGSVVPAGATLAANENAHETPLYYKTIRTRAGPANFKNRSTEFETNSNHQIRHHNQLNRPFSVLYSSEDRLGHAGAFVASATGCRSTRHARTLAKLLLFVPARLGQHRGCSEPRRCLGRV